MFLQVACLSILLALPRKKLPGSGSNPRPDSCLFKISRRALKLTRFLGSMSTGRLTWNQYLLAICAGR